MESPLMCFCDGSEIIGAPRDQLTMNDVSIPISSRLHPLMSARFLYLKCPSGWFKSGLPQIWMQHLRSPLPFYWFKRILNSMHAVMSVLRFPQVISVGLYLDECTATRTQIFHVYFYYEINFYCGKLGHEFTVTTTGIHGLEPPCMSDRDRFND